MLALYLMSNFSHMVDLMVPTYVVDLMGTSRPTHYHVLYDENHFTADVLHSLTNNLFRTHYMQINKAPRGVRVETNHQEDQIRRYKITGITPVLMSQLIFPIDERGTRMSVVQYFKQRYDYNLKYTSWPCLQSGSDARPVYLPMEACKIIEGQRYSKRLNDKQVTNILRTTCQRPQQREQSVREMVLHNKYAEDKFAQEFGIQVCSDLVAVPARVLPSPMLRYHDSGKEKTCAPSVVEWNMINKVSGSNLAIQKGFTRFGQPAITKVPTIIFGADVTHPPPGEDSASSIAVVMASMDWPENTKYRGLVSAQPHRQEIIEDLFSVTKDPQRGNVNGGMIRELLIAFHRKTGRRPERILFYRDGVSEGQFSHVLLHEMDSIRKACASLEEGYMPEVNFIPVEGKHYARLSREKREMTDKKSCEGNIIRQIMIYHEGLTKSEQTQFETVVNKVGCPTAWFTGILQKHFIFSPSVAFRKRKHWPAYETTAFGCFKCLRNTSTHGSALTDYAGPMLLGSFVCDIIRELLRHKCPIQKALGL